MKARIEQLELQQFQLVSTHHTTTNIPLEDVLAAVGAVESTMEVDSPGEAATVEVKSEEEEITLESTFHPAVMESVFLDQQCLSSNSLPSTFLPPRPPATTTSSPTPLSFSAITLLLMRLLLLSLIPLSVLTRIYMKEWDNLLRTTLVKKMIVLPISAPATFNSLNTGSLFTGAEMGCANVFSSQVGNERGCFLSWSDGSMDKLIGNGWAVD